MASMIGAGPGGSSKPTESFIEVFHLGVRDQKCGYLSAALLGSLARSWDEN